MALNRLLFFGALAAACGSPPRGPSSDAGALVADAGSLVADAGSLASDAGPLVADAGLVASDAGPFVADAGSLFDAGSADAGAISDSGSLADASVGTDAGPAPAPYGPCNDGLWLEAGSVLDGGAAGVTVLGLQNPNEVRVLAGGERFDGALYLFNDARLVITPGDGGFATLAGSVTMLGRSRLIADGGALRIPQTQGTRFTLYAGDEAKVVLSKTALVLGSTDNNLWTAAMCGRSTLELSSVDLLREKKSTPTPFAFDSAKIVIDDPNDFVEVSIASQAHGLVRNARSATVGAYLTVSDSVPHELHLASGFVDGGQSNVLRATDGGDGARLDVFDSNVFYALWVAPDANVTLRDSALGLFLKLDHDAVVDGLAGSSAPRTETLALSDRTIRLIDSSVYPVNAYFEPTAPGTLRLSNSFIGELTCSGPFGTTCAMTGAGIDGTGGFVTVAEAALLTMENAELNTYLVARDSARAHLRQVAHRANPSLPAPFRKPLSIQAVGRSLVVLENQNPFVSTLEDGGAVPQQVFDEAAVVNAAIYLDPNDAADTEYGAAVSRPIYGAATVTTDGGTHRLLRSTLFATQGTAHVQLATTGQSLPPLSQLGVLDTAKLDAGSWTLHLTVELESGVAADVTHPLRVSPP